MGNGLGAVPCVAKESEVSILLHIRSLREGLPLFRALNSDIRISIMELLYQKGPLRMSAIADKLGITAGALTPHIKVLKDCGMITVDMVSGKHGVQKICYATDESIMIDPVQQRTISGRNSGCDQAAY